MNTRCKLTTFFMLFIFGVLSVKSLFVDLEETSICDEFNHIHIFKSQNISKKISHQNNLAAQKSEEDQDCHQGHLVLTCSLNPYETFNFVKSHFALAYEIIYSIENHFKNSHLEPHRKPPKIS